MPEPVETRVAVYIDFDNIVISRYNQLHGKGAFQKDKARDFVPNRPNADAGVTGRLEQATVDLGAILDFASSFGSIALSRAYADWSVMVNASYQKQLGDRAVDLTQLFPATQQMKNGADIRLAVDVVEDLFRLPELTHIVIVAGDSDYIALAQRCKRLGRYVVGVGVAGGTSKALTAACDQFADYDALPGTPVPQPLPERAAPEAAAIARSDGQVDAARGTEVGRGAKRKADKAQAAATDLLVRALRLGHAKNDLDWLTSGNVKNQMLRMDPSFNERALDYRSFTEFVKSRGSVADFDEASPGRLIRLVSDLMVE